MLLLKNCRMIWFAVALFAVSLTVVQRAEAVAIFTNTDVTPITTLLEGSGATTIDFYVDTAGALANIVGTNLVLVTTGSIQVTGNATCPGGDFLCSTTGGFPNQGPFSYLFTTAGAGFAADFLLGSVPITVGAGPGTIQIAASPASTALDFSFGSYSFAGGTILVNTVVPEPSTLLLLGAGIAGLLLSGRRRNRA